MGHLCERKHENIGNDGSDSVSGGGENFDVQEKQNKMDDALIEKLAAEELLQEAKRGAARASLNGPSGWQKCPLPKTNKRFLQNTILHSLQSNRLSQHVNKNKEHAKETTYKHHQNNDKQSSKPTRDLTRHKKQLVDKKRKESKCISQKSVKCFDRELNKIDAIPSKTKLSKNEIVS